MREPVVPDAAGRISAAPATEMNVSQWVALTKSISSVTAHLLLAPVGFLAVATLATTVQRIVHVAAKLPGPRAPSSERGGDEPGAS